MVKVKETLVEEKKKMRRGGKIRRELSNRVTHRIFASLGNLSSRDPEGQYLSS